MSLETAIQDNTNALNELIALLKTQAATTANQAVQTESKSAPAPTTAVMQHQTVDVSKAEPVADITELETSTDEQPVYTTNDVKEILIKIASKNPAAKRHAEILKKYGATKLSDIKEADFSAVYADAQAMLESM